MCSNINTMEEYKSFKINVGTWERLTKIFKPLKHETLNCYFNRIAECLEEGKMEYIFKHG